MSTMRRAGRAGAALTGLALALAGLGAPGAGADQRAGVFKLTFAGQAAMASWATCADLESVELGTMCAGADVMAFDAATSEQAGSDVHIRDPRSGTLRIYEYRCEVVEFEWDPGVWQRECVLRWERFGRAENADVTTDPRMQEVHAMATVPVQVWDAEAGESFGSVDVEAHYTGVGPTERIDERTHYTDRYVMFLEGTRGWERSCEATATFDGDPVSGDLVGCSLSRVRQAEVRVYHNMPE